MKMNLQLFAAEKNHHHQNHMSLLPRRAIIILTTTLIGRHLARRDHSGKRAAELDPL